ncbi:MAG: shikimate dehydrogenase [Candidatus Daviesbacteria bacterium]|nr:shikimate dehydrogenase [Candidatus Daviesbacteria bacterium]
MKICLGIGYPIKSSRSPAMHNAGYKKLGIDDEFVYLTTEVKTKDLKMAIDGARGLGIRGISVTMPHKHVVMKYLDKINKEAKIIGAVNTIVNDNGKLTGFNTDYIGALVALEKKIDLKGKKVAIIGAGGAARAIVYGLIKKGAIVKIFNRSLDKTRSLAQEFGCKYGSLDSLEEILRMDVVINATSVGMNEDKSPIDKKFLNKNQLVFDIVYTPKETRLIKDAKEKGAQVILGYEMLLYQGVEQFKLYTGRKAPVETMKEVLIKSLNEN